MATLKLSKDLGSECFVGSWMKQSMFEISSLPMILSLKAGTTLRSSPVNFPLSIFCCFMSSYSSSLGTYISSDSLGFDSAFVSVHIDIKGGKENSIEYTSVNLNCKYS